MRVSDATARLILLDLDDLGGDETQTVRVRLGEYRALLRDRIELAERVAELTDRLALAERPRSPR